MHTGLRPAGKENRKKRKSGFCDFLGPDATMSLAAAGISAPAGKLPPTPATKKGKAGFSDFGGSYTAQPLAPIAGGAGAGNSLVPTVMHVQASESIITLSSPVKSATKLPQAVEVTMKLANLSSPGMEVEPSPSATPSPSDPRVYEATMRLDTLAADATDELPARTPTVHDSHHGTEGSVGQNSTAPTAATASKAPGSCHAAVVERVPSTVSKRRKSVRFSLLPIGAIPRNPPHVHNKKMYLSGLGWNRRWGLILLDGLLGTLRVEVKGLTDEPVSKTPTAL